MTESACNEAETAPPPAAQLIQMATGHIVSQIVYCAAKLGLADHLAQGRKSADDLARVTGTDAPSLFRFMRTLAHLGILEHDGLNEFGLTPLGEALRTGAPGSARATVLTTASDWWSRGFGHLLYSVQTGKSGFEKALGMPIFDWLARHPEEASRFSETMIGLHGAEAPTVAAGYHFADLATIVDVGGGTGNMLSAILSRYPGARGILYDLPHVVRDAPALLRARGCANRVAIESGSFFENVPTGGDAYLLSHIIHDWPEDQCLTILGNCRRAMKRGSRLLIIEMVLPSNGQPHPGKMLDLIMLVAPGGRERTQAEYATLLRRADLRLNRVVPTDSAVSVVEAVLA